MTVTLSPGVPSITGLYEQVSSLSPSQHAILRELAKSADALSVDDIAGPLELHTNTVREVLAALVELKLVTRETERSETRGRPRWLYRATVSIDPAVVLQSFSSFTAVAAQQIAKLAPNPEEVALELGRAWGKEVLGDPSIPDHSEIDAHTASTRDLSIHAAKLRVFLSQMGFEARPGDNTTTIVMEHCPLRNGTNPTHPLACAVHQGMLNEIVETLSRDHLTTRLLPLAQPTACEVHLCPRFPA